MMLPIVHPQAGGLKLCNVDVAKPLDVVRAMVEGQRLIFVDEGFFETLNKRNLLDRARQIAFEQECELGGYFNWWSIPAKTDLLYKPTYHRMRLECDRLNAWLRRTDGTIVIGWGAGTADTGDDWHVWDVTHPKMRAFAAKQILALRQRWKLGRLMADEMHAGLWSLVCGTSDEEKAADRATIPVTDVGWADGNRILARQSGGGIQPNGTFGMIEGDFGFAFPASISGIFCQDGIATHKALNEAISKLVDADQGIPESGRVLVLQDGYQADGGRFLTALAACLDAMPQQCDRAFRSAYNPLPFERGSWGRRESVEFNGDMVLGAFERVDVRVNLNTRSVLVQGRSEGFGLPDVLTEIPT